MRLILPLAAVLASTVLAGGALGQTVDNRDLSAVNTQYALPDALALAEQEADDKDPGKGKGQEIADKSDPNATQVGQNVAGAALGALDPSKLIDGGAAGLISQAAGLSGSPLVANAVGGLPAGLSQIPGLSNF
jgi:hypothetical protein